MTILTAGIDLAKNVFAVHGVNDAGKAELFRPAVPRDKLHALIASLNRPGFRGGSNSREWSHEEVPEVFARGA